MKTEYEWNDGIPWARRVSEPGDWEAGNHAYESPESRIRRLFQGQHADQ